MLINIANLDSEYEEKTVLVTYPDSWTLDKSICIIMGSLLQELAVYSTDYPADFSSLLDWQHELNTKGKALKDYYHILDTQDEVEELHLVQDAKEAFKFVSEYLEELWVKDESNI